MNSKPGPITGSWLLTPKVHADSRGQFVESFQKGVFAKQTGLSIDFIQDNEVVSQQGVVRGLHLQNDPHEQAKLIRVVLGKIYDVAVDLRTNSSTYGEWFGVALSAENHTQLFLPKGFAHGYSVLSERAIVQYKVDSAYNPQAESGIRFDDPDLGIDWQVDNPILSEKDQKLPFLKDLNP
ncbi:MAG: dTDP-4-dehydrorhamnose 3,5-epimerase [Flavobacteriaceae bacterium]|jgi:dTDP-4-dehydrorhamnose 3,5-epimerase|nr:MAG: dTDP-4-dehydrorhamnose 3,5-epimerase [Flavobacteriaceae bacterium TMED81]|tara:strand:+ start:1067 stop:1606 length:540 start_codon:yes stop_codon:yes gene_type:complete